MTSLGKAGAGGDLLVFGTVALASLSSGALQHLVGWSAVNLGVLLPLLGALAALFRLRRQLAAARPLPAR